MMRKSLPEGLVKGRMFEKGSFADDRKMLRDFTELLGELGQPG